MERGGTVYDIEMHANRHRGLFHFNTMPVFAVLSDCRTVGLSSLVPWKAPSLGTGGVVSCKDGYE